MLRHPFIIMPSRRERPSIIWDTHGISGNVFVNPDASSSAPFPQELHQWNSSIEEPLHSSAVEKSEMPEQNQDLRCQSGPSAKDSVIFSGARIASALNKIIHNSHFKRRISLEEQKAQKQDRFLRGRQIAYLIYDYFRVTGNHDSVENYADLFTIISVYGMMIFRNSIQSGTEFHCL